MYVPSQTSPQGVLELWVDIMKPEVASAFPPEGECVVISLYLLVCVCSHIACLHNMFVVHAHKYVSDFSELVDCLS